MENWYMDYNNPTESGQVAFLRGIKRNENPVSTRTDANAALLWDRGWVRQSKITCKGIELSPGAYSGCTQTVGDCPACGVVSNNDN